MPRAGKAPLTPVLHRQTLTFASAVLEAPPALTEREQQHYIGKPNLLRATLRIALCANGTPIATFPQEVLMANERLYQTLFGKTPDFSGIKVPEIPTLDAYLTVIVAKELVEWTGGQSIEGVFHARKKLYPTWKYTADSLDEVITENERTLASGGYAFAAREILAPDADLIGKSANDIAETKIVTMTTLEYMLFETMYFQKHGVHLDPRHGHSCQVLVIATVMRRAAVGMAAGRASVGPTRRIAIRASAPAGFGSDSPTFHFVISPRCARASGCVFI